MKMNKIVAIVISLLLITILGYSISYADAGSISISASNTSVNVGDTVNIVVTVNNAAGKFTLSASENLTLEKTEDFADQQSITIKATAKSAGTATVTVTAADITDYDKNPVTGSKSVNITVNEKQTSTGGGSTTGNNDTQTQTPSNPTNTGNTSTTTSNEPTFTEVNQTVYVYNTESVNVRSGPGTSYSSLGRVARNTAVTRTGVGSNGWSRVSYNGQTAYISSSYLTTTKPEEEAKSSNAMLSGLTVDVEGLSPEFNKDTDNYTLQVGSDVEAIQITATPEDENATVQVQGNENLQEGENTVTITVTAGDGTTKVYTITVNKGNVEQVASLGLSTLTIAGIDMEEVFSPTTYEYTIEINEDVTQLDITAEANEEGATVEIVGNQDFQEGENIVSIIVKSANGEETVTYQLTINKNTAAVAENSNQTQNLIFICLFVGIVVVIIIVVSILLYKRNKKKIEEEYDFGNGEEDNQFYNDNFENTIEGQDEQEDTVYQNTIQQGYTDVVEDEEEIEEKPKRKKGKHF